MYTYCDVNESLPSMKNVSLTVSESEKKAHAINVLENHVPLYVGIRDRIEDLEKSIKSEVNRLEADGKAHTSEIKLAMEMLGYVQYSAWDGSKIHITHTRKVDSEGLATALAKGQIKPLHSDEPLVVQLLRLMSADDLIKVFGEEALQGFIVKKPYAVKRGEMKGRK